MNEWRISLYSLFGPGHRIIVVFTVFWSTKLVVKVLVDDGLRWLIDRSDTVVRLVLWTGSCDGRARKSASSTDARRQHGDAAGSTGETANGRSRLHDDILAQTKNQLHLRPAASSAPVFRRVSVHRRSSASWDRGSTVAHRDTGIVAWRSADFRTFFEEVLELRKPASFSLHRSLSAQFAADNNASVDAINI